MSSVGNRRDAKSQRYRAWVAARFLTRTEVADELAISESQVYALIRRKDLRALKIGGRGTWRIGRDDLEALITRLYKETGIWIDEHPFTEDSPSPDD